MVGTGTLVTLVVAGLASFFMAWAIGAGSSGSTPFAPAVGANAISVMRAGFIVGLLGFGGAVLQGANVTQAVGTELIVGVKLTALAAIVGLLTAAILVAIGVFTGYPIATAFTVTGAVVGVGLALGGDPAWAKYRQIATLWTLTPFVGGGTAYLTAALLRSERLPERWVVSALAGLVGVLVGNIEFAALGPPDQTGTLAGTLARHLSRMLSQSLGRALSLSTLTVLVTLGFAAVTATVLFDGMGRDKERAERRFLLSLGALVAFSAGGSQVGLALGPLVPLLDEVQIPLSVVLLGGGVGLLAGSWTGAPRMIKALSQDYSSLGPRRSIAALIPSFAIAQAAVAFGIPVSFNEIIVSAIIGSGYAAGGGDVSKRKMLFTVLAWVGSLVLALVTGYGIFSVISAL